LKINIYLKVFRNSLSDLRLKQLLKKKKEPDKASVSEGAEISKGRGNKKNKEMPDIF